MRVMPLVEFRNVCYEVGGRQILSEVNLTVEAGETLVLLGRSGSGKTTALKMVNGLLFPTDGQVLVDGKPTTAWDLIKLRRSIGYVIQDVGLFPHFTVKQNVALVPKLENWDPARIDRTRARGRLVQTRARGDRLDVHKRDRSRLFECREALDEAPKLPHVPVPALPQISSRPSAGLPKRT